MMPKKRYSLGVKTKSHRWQIGIVVAVVLLAALVVGGVFALKQYYVDNMAPVSDSSEQIEVTIESGMLPPEIAKKLHDAGLIRSEAAFLWYVKSKDASQKIMAGTYRLQPSLTTPQIVTILTKGKVATDLITILPGQRLDEIQKGLVAAGFSEQEIDLALQPSQYKDNPALVDKPDYANLEGYIYPESFQRTSATRPQDVITASLAEMDKKMTPEIRDAFKAKGLTVYEGIIFASIVESEAYRQEDRSQIAQVFLKRLELGMQLESDPTAKYGAILAGQKCPTSCVSFSSSYNTYEIDGLPPTPISNVSESSLRAVAFPANTDWLFFVAGDDGKTYFSKTLAEHEALTEQHCTELCGN